MSRNYGGEPGDPIREDARRGTAVNIAARVAGEAGPAETLVSSTVKDLVAGSGLQFSDRGIRTLKGVAEPWHLYAASPN